LVKNERHDQGGQGRAISLLTPEPWPDPVDGAELLDAIADAIRCYVVMFDYSRDATALWSVHTFLLDCFMVSPLLAITSPTKQCGKTTLLDVLSRIVFKPLPAANITPSVVFRVVEAHRPTLLIDEADSFLRGNEELRNVLNTGHRRGGSSIRNAKVRDDYEPRQFSTFSATAIALIGKLPDTLTDRSVTVKLKRRLVSETITQFRFDRVDHLDVLARKAARWTEDNADRIKEADPVMPAGTYNRLADNWRPLLAIADAADGQWPERARRALGQGSAVAEDQGPLVLLLKHIKTMSEDNITDRISSAELVASLIAIEGGPWAEYGKRGKPITQNQVAYLLKPIGIGPENVRIGEQVLKGYSLIRFTEAFERYLPSISPTEPLQRYKPTAAGTSPTFRTATPDPDVAVRKCENLLSPNDCSGVAVEKGGCPDISDNDLGIPEFLDRTQTVCEHCGGIERPGKPVELFVLDGTEYLMHPNCRKDWLAGPNPDDWTFNLEIDPDSTNS
jgi:putative DNA primase/helicase